MKKIYNLIACAMVSGALAGCSLDYEPVDTYSDVTEGVTKDEVEIVFKDRAAVESYMMTIEKKFHDRQEHWYMDRLLMAESHADNAYAGTTGAEVVPFEDNSIDGSNSVVERDWNRFMEDAAVATKLICNIEKVQDGSLSQNEINSYRAQAEIFRAMIWFDMVRMWGDIPCITTEAGNITAENIEEVYPAYFPSQNAEIDVYKAIEADLLDAVQYAPDGTADKTKFSKTVARALLAKMYAEKPLQDYNKVITYVDAVNADGIDLVDDFSELFGVQGIPHYDESVSAAMPIATNTRESIFEAVYPVGSGNWTPWMFGRDVNDWDYSFTWAKWVTPSRDIIRLFESQGDTKRYNESVVWYECAWSNYYPSDNYAFMYKNRSAYSSIIKMRYADLLLLKAEAYIVGPNQNLTAAADIIDRIRQRAGLGRLSAAVRANRDELLKAYMDERRMELAFEGERWFDLVRLDKVEEVMNAVYAKDSGRKAQRNLYNTNSYRLPIPQKVLDSNENLVQNPGY